MCGRRWPHLSVQEVAVVIVSGLPRDLNEATDLAVTDTGEQRRASSRNTTPALARPPAGAVGACGPR
jgi:hypothetical protein